MDVPDSEGGNVRYVRKHKRIIFIVYHGSKTETMDLRDIPPWKTTGSRDSQRKVHWGCLKQQESLHKYVTVGLSLNRCQQTTCLHVSETALLIRADTSLPVVRNVVTVVIDIGLTRGTLPDYVKFINISNIVS